MPARHGRFEDMLDCRHPASDRPRPGWGRVIPPQGRQESHGDPSTESRWRNGTSGARTLQRFVCCEETPSGVPKDCRLHLHNLREVKATFQDFTDDWETRLVHFHVRFPDYTIPVMETYPYMENSYLGTQWVWASGNYGKKMLSLPLDADVLSLYLLARQRRRMQLSVSTHPINCLVMLSPECRLEAVRTLIIDNVTHSVGYDQSGRNYVCHYVIRNTPGSTSSKLIHRCCDVREFRSGDTTCRTFTDYSDEIDAVMYIIYALSVVFTLYSPIAVLKIKIALTFDSVTKFFRASLKHGITGQRNYVIRISSRQLINLNDRCPFSIPRTIFRLVCHCYGEGRCCIHWWAEWSHQPAICGKNSRCRQGWLFAWKAIGILIAYPILLHLSVALYAPRLPFYQAVLEHTKDSEHHNPVSLNINLVASCLVLSEDFATSVWVLFSILAFAYTLTVLSWPNNPLERCLLRNEGKRPSDQPGLLRRRLNTRYKAILDRLAYGEYDTKRHFFRIPWLPWGLRRTGLALVRIFMFIPVVNVCFATYITDGRVFEKPVSSQTKQSRDEAVDEITCSRPSPRSICRSIVTSFVWFGFVLILLGYCTTVFLMTQFLLSVIFFIVVTSVMHTTSVLPWIFFASVMTMYVNDTLATINTEHRHILRLIDENSPRISAVEHTELDGSGIRVLKAHNLGAVKFIDGDNTEYVSKELYYNVCTDLKCGWSNTSRRIYKRTSKIFLFLVFHFSVLHATSAFNCGSGVMTAGLAILGSAAPKLVELYCKAMRKETEVDIRNTWAKLIPDVLDRHIRVDRTQAAIDEGEEELSTYDVRPVGFLEIDLPRLTVQRSLRLCKFPWVVSCDQQTQSNEGFVIALANKLAAASFLSKIVTRDLSTDLRDETVLKQWSLLVENCIIESSVTAGNVNAANVDTISLFSPEVQPLVFQFEAGNTIDSLVDSVNRELYSLYVVGILATVANTSCALYKVNNQIIAFNSSCHGDQVTDLFGAVLIVTDFNAQNLQSIFKYLADPYRPDAVPVYSIVPVEGFVFRSPEILEIESVV